MFDIRCSVNSIVLYCVVVRRSAFEVLGNRELGWPALVLDTYIDMAFIVLMARTEISALSAMM